MAGVKSTQNLDIFRNSDAGIAAAYRPAADTMRHDPHWTDEEREQRARYYEEQAKRHEGRAS